MFGVVLGVLTCGMSFRIVLVVGLLLQFVGWLVVCLYCVCCFCSWACVVSLACGFVVLFCYLIVLLVLVAVGLVGLLVSLLIAAIVLFWVLMLDYCWLV